MTGLDVERDVIVEVATLITDDDLAIVAEGPDLVVSASPSSSRPWTTSSATCTPKAACSRRSPRRPLAGGGGDGHPRLHPRPRAEGPDRPTGRELDRDRPPLPGRPAPGHRGVPPLPLRRRLDRQGAHPPLVPRGRPGAPVKAGGPPGHGRHPRERGRAGLLPDRRVPDRRPDRPGRTGAGSTTSDRPSAERSTMADPPPANRAGADRRPSLAEVTATLTAPGALFEMEDLVIRGSPPASGRTPRPRSAPSSSCPPATATRPSSSTRTSG